MSATYTYSGDPSESDKDRVRFMLGDTVLIESRMLVSDEEIAAAISYHGSVEYAAAACAETIAAYYARVAQQTAGSVNASFVATSERYLELADRFRSSAEVLPYPIVGGVSVEDKETVEADTDRVEPFFKRDGED